MATANAPVVFFDEVPNHGYYNGICHITLEVLRFMAVDGVAVSDRAVAAHLRMNVNALAALKNAIAGIDRQIEQQAAAAAAATKH
jgi:hypothetical protein